MLFDVFCCCRAFRFSSVVVYVFDDCWELHGCMEFVGLSFGGFSSTFVKLQQ